MTKQCDELKGTTPKSEVVVPRGHEWLSGGYGHGTMHCKWCSCTEREASFALGNECPKAPVAAAPQPEADDWSELERLARAAEKRAPGQWERDTEKGEGEYGIGDDTHSGYMVPYVMDSRGKRLFDAHASEIALIEEDHSFDENGADYSSWDQASCEVLDFAAAANPSAILALIAASRRGDGPPAPSADSGGAVAWLVEAPGANYLAVRTLGRSEFYWTTDANKALRFFTKDEADQTAMAVRLMQPDLWAFALTLGEAWPREHKWLALQALAQPAPQEAGDGWIEWSGGENPVPGKVVDAELGFGTFRSCLSDIMKPFWTDAGRYRVVAPQEGEGR